METSDFYDYLAGFGYDEAQLAESIDGVELFESFIKGAACDAATSAEQVISLFISELSERDLCTRQRLVGLYLYAGLVSDQAIQLALLERLDGQEILGNLRTAIGRVLGPEIESAIFADIEMPALGSGPRDWTRTNAAIMPRLEAAANPEQVREILRSELRSLRDEHYLPLKERYEEMEDVDAFLADRGRRHLEILEDHRDEGTPYFNQMIDDDVIEFVRRNPEIGGGVREGATIVEIKIPHQAVEYLAAEDLAAKQYHVCHCPLVKESMAPDGPELSSTFCDFCPSFNAKPWEVIFGRKLDYEVIESAKRGDVWCRFAIHLPLDIATAESRGNG